MQECDETTYGQRVAEIYDKFTRDSQKQVSVSGCAD